MPIPTDIQLLQKKRLLIVTFDTGEQFEFSCEYLRVYSPSADVRGHGVSRAEQVVFPPGKKDVNIIGLEPVGQYALKIIFDDGHSTGLYSWETLYDLGINKALYWQRYITAL